MEILVTVNIQKSFGKCSEMFNDLNPEAKKMMLK